MTTKQLPGAIAPDGSTYVTLTDGSGSLSGATGVLYSKVTVDFNAGNTDTQIPIVLPGGFTRYRLGGPLSVANGYGTISGASASITTATFGVFSAAAGAGTAITAAGTAITVSATAENTANNMQTITSGLTTSTESLNFTTLFFRVGTAQGSAATATVTVFYIPVS